MNPKHHSAPLSLLNVISQPLFVLHRLMLLIFQSINCTYGPWVPYSHLFVPPVHCLLSKLYESLVLHFHHLIFRVWGLLSRVLCLCHSLELLQGVSISLLNKVTVMSSCRSQHSNTVRRLPPGWTRVFVYEFFSYPLILFYAVGHDAAKITYWFEVRLLYCIK